MNIPVKFSGAPGIFGFFWLERYLSEIPRGKVDLVEKSALKPCIGRRTENGVLYVWQHRGAPWMGTFCSTWNIFEPIPGNGPACPALPIAVDRFGAAPLGLVHLEIIRPGKSKVFGILKERVDQVGLLAAPDLVWNPPDPESMPPDKIQPLLPVFLAVKLQFHMAPP